MRELLDDDLAALKAAIEKMRDALSEYLEIIADPGEPEVATEAVVFFQSEGLDTQGRRFSRLADICLEQADSSRMLGMIISCSDKVRRRFGRADE